jgi:hypothetical protein
MFTTETLYAAFLRLVRRRPVVGVLEKMSDSAPSHAGRRGSSTRPKPLRPIAPALAILTVLSAMLVGAVAAQTASAGGICSPNGVNYYGEACLYGTNFYGLRGTIQSEVMSVENVSSEHVINDMYIVNHSSTPPHFIEAGIMYGRICENEDFETGVCYKEYITVSKNHKFFWADLRPGTDYYAHFNQVASMDTAYKDEIHHESPETWGITVGPDTGTSTKNPLLANLIRAGTEITSQSAAVACSEQYNLEWESAESTWDSGWTDSEESAKVESDNPPWAKWINTDHWLRDGANVFECFGEEAPVLAPAHPSVAASPTGPSESPANTTDAQPLGVAQLRESAREFATGMGDSTPSSMEYVTGNHKQVVLALSGDEVEGNTNVDAIIMHGSFVANHAPRPSEAAAPSGTVLTLVINATTGELTDFGLQNTEPNIAAFGPVNLAN